MSSSASEPIDRSSLDRVVRALDERGFPTKRSDDFMTLCPCHDDRTPSMHVTWSDGKVMLHCFSCSPAGSASWEDLAAGLGLNTSDLYDAPPTRPDRDQPAKIRKPREHAHKLPARITNVAGAEQEVRHRFAVVRTYDYFDVQGTLVQQVVREECTIKAHPAKRFKQVFIDPRTGREVSKKPRGFVPVPYNLPAVVDAVERGGVVYLVEGEKDCETAAEHGLVATTNAQGSGSFTEAMAHWFVGHAVEGERNRSRVVIVADRDGPGFKRAADLQILLTDVGAKASIVFPATTEPKSDLSDHFAAGYRVDDLVPAPLSVVQLFVQHAEMVKAVANVRDCLDEAASRQGLAEAEPEAAEEHREAARTWVKEASRRLSKVRELGAVPAEVSSEAADTVSAITKLRDEAFELVQEAHRTAGLKPPAAVLDTRGGEVVPLRTGDQPGAMVNDPAPHLPNQAAWFTVRGGETVRVVQSGAGEDEKLRYETVLNCWATVLDQFVEDDGVESEEAKPGLGMRVRFGRWARDEKGRPQRNRDGSIAVEEETVTWSAEAISKGQWIDLIPWYGAAALASTSRRGKDAAMDGILKAVPGPAKKTERYSTSGWRKTKQGRIFIHAGGAIGSTGPVEADVLLPDSLSVYKMADPTTDGDELRTAWERGIKPLLEDLPARVIFPLLGFACESVFEDRIKTTMHLQGGSSSYKTAAAGLAMQLFAPGVHYRGRREVVSGANGGGTTLGVMRTISIAAHLPVLVDDFAPDGDPKKAQKKLGDLARANFNGTVRSVGAVTGGTRNDRPLKAGVITTGELGADDSAETRLFTIPLAPGDINRAQDLFPQLEISANRKARALLGSSLIQWLAAAMDDELAERRFWMDNPTAAHNPYTRWVEAVRTLPHDSRLEGRFSDAAQWCSHGIHLLMRMLVDRGALSETEAAYVFDQANDGILSALRLQNDVAGDAAHRMINLLREAIAAGDAHLTSVRGDAPAEPELREAAGWFSRTYMNGAEDISGQLTAGGTKIGAIRGDRVLLLPSVAMGVANNIANRAESTFNESAVSIGSAMISHGWVSPDSDGKSQTQCRISGKKMRAWDIPLHVLFGDSDDEPETGSGPDLPPPPDLFPAAPTELPVEFEDINPTEPTDDEVNSAVPSHTFIDLEGTRITVEHLPEPWPECIMCHRPAAGAIDGHPLHQRCWNAAVKISPDHPSTDTDEVEEEDAQDAERGVPPTVPDPAEEDDGDLDREQHATQVPQFTAPAAVLDVDGVYLPDGSRHDLPAPLTHIGHLAELADELGLGTVVRQSRNKENKVSYRAEPGQIWITAAATHQLLGMSRDFEVDRGKRVRQIREQSTGHAFLTGALNDGWAMTNEGQYVEGSIRLWREDDQRRAMVTFIPALGDDAGPLVTTETEAGRVEADPVTIARRLDKFATALKYPYQVSASSTGFNLLSETRRDRKTSLAVHEPVPPAAIPGLVLDHDWTRALTGEEVNHQWAHAYDRSASYLAAADTNYGIGPAQHLENPEAYDGSMPGLWKIAIPEQHEWLHPSIFNPGNRALTGEGWYTSETLNFATDPNGLDYDVKPLEAYVWPEKARVLGAWSKRVTAARTALDTADGDDQAARDTLKSLYVRMFGLMGSSEFQAGRRGYAPERYHLLKARAGANILRRILRIGQDTGRWPVAVFTDTVIYTSDNPDGAAAWPGDPQHLSRGAGMYKHEGTVELDKLKPFLTGQKMPREARQLLTIREG